jgi:hypothetical protein
MLFNPWQIMLIAMAGWLAPEARGPEVRRQRQSRPRKTTRSGLHPAPRGSQGIRESVVGIRQDSGLGPFRRILPHVTMNAFAMVAVVATRVFIAHSNASSNLSTEGGRT